MSRTRLRIIALVSLGAFALLAVAVSHGQGPSYFERGALHFEHHAFPGLGPNAAGSSGWPDVASLLAVPVIGAVLLVSLVYGALRRVLRRVAVYGALAGAAFLIGEEIMKPLVQQRFHGELSFPSGNVTAVCATALAMWMALYPVMGKWARVTTFVLGAGWTLLMAQAVVGAYWHTPLDTVGSVLLSVGILTAGGSFFERAARPSTSVPLEYEPILDRV
jgi:membrane-associated phospholipid phosphatase